MSCTIRDSSSSLDQRQDRGAGADLAGAEFERADRPGFAQHPEQRRAERGRARVAGLQFVEAARQFAGQPRLVHAEVLEDAGEIRPPASSSFIRKCSISTS